MGNCNERSNDQGINEKVERRKQAIQEDDKNQKKESQTQETKKDLEVAENTDQEEYYPERELSSDIIFGKRDFSLVWLDTKIGSKENQTYRENFEKLFKEVLILKDADETLLNAAIQKASLSVVFISSGTDYSKIGTIVESNDLVSAIFIFCADWTQYTDLKERGGKIIDVIDNFGELASCMGQINQARQHLKRFFEEREERTFYDISDREKIINSLTIACKGDKFSVFYPLGTKRLKFQEYLTPKVIEEIKLIAKGDEKIASRVNKIIETLDFTEKNKTAEGIIASYTMDGLYYMLNLYLRFGSEQGFGLFKEYMFCLKASICQLGTPIAETGIKLYRGLTLREEFLKKYIEKKGQIILLNAFTSTTLARKVAMEFALKSTGGQCVIFELTTVNFDDSFTQFIASFGFPEENGVFFPVDICKFSRFQSEQEVLLPPFYPIKIKDVFSESYGNRSYTKIIAETPYSVSVAGKDFIKNILKGETQETDWNETYVESLFDLIQKKVVDKLSIVKLEIDKNKKIQEFIEKKLKDGFQISKILIGKQFT